MNLSIYTQDKPISGTLLSHIFLKFANKVFHLLISCFVLVWMTFAFLITSQMHKDLLKSSMSYLV
jgi:hypothetical protein